MSLPSDLPEPITIQKTDLSPARPSDSQSLWKKFIDGLRTAVGFKPVYLAERFAEARIATTEAENEIKLLKAKQDYELVQAQIRQMDGTTEANRLDAETKARRANAEARRDESKARMMEWVVQQLKAGTLSREEAGERLREVISQIEMWGGYVEFDLPKSLDGPSAREDDSEA